jgi:hypothetical protein
LPGSAAGSWTPNTASSEAASGPMTLSTAAAGGDAATTSRIARSSGPRVCVRNSVADTTRAATSGGSAS